MQTLWFILVALMLTTYILLDGFDLGAGVIHLFAARNDQERRTILIGLLALPTLTAHGANYIAVKTLNAVNARARRISRLAWLATIVLAIPATIVTFSVQPLVSASFFSRPWGVIFPLIALGGLICIGYFNFRQRDMPAVLSSGAFILGLLTSSPFSLYPH